MGHSDHHSVSHEKVSISSKEIQKLISRASAQTFAEAPRYPSDFNSGVVPMTLAGRFANERARLGPDFTEADRQYRIKYLQSQHLEPGEPFVVPYKKQAHLNIFRRIYRAPLDILENALKVVGMHPAFASVTRKMVGRTIIGYGVILWVWYQLNYNTATWEVSRGPVVHHTRETVLPGDIRYPMPNPRTESWQHYDRQFHDRKVFLNIGQKN